MGDWNDLSNFGQYRRDELAAEAKSRARTTLGRGSQAMLAMLTVAVILLGMIAWWGQ